jgi:hypothetical protein
MKEFAAFVTFPEALVFWGMHVCMYVMVLNFITNTECIGFLNSGILPLHPHAFNLVQKTLTGSHFTPPPPQPKHAPSPPHSNFVAVFTTMHISEV